MRGDETIKSFCQGKGLSDSAKGVSRVEFFWKVTGKLELR